MSKKLIHPGKIMQEEIIKRNMNQKELAARTGFTEKHISTVISGYKVISPDFAYRLEVALGIPYTYWANLQQEYDYELIKKEELKSVTSSEKVIAKRILPLLYKINNKAFESPNSNETIVEIRNLLNVSNLNDLSSLLLSRVKRSFNNLNDEYIYMYTHLASTLARTQTTNKLDIDKLTNLIDELIEVSHLPYDEHIEELTNILNKAGVLLLVTKYEKNVSPKSYNYLTKDNQALIGISIKGNYIDEFWYLLFKEIYHIINNTNSRQDKRAFTFAYNTLVDTTAYNAFIKKKDFELEDVIKFSKDNNIIMPIVVGRLISDNLWSWYFNHHRDQYDI